MTPIKHPKTNPYYADSRILEMGCRYMGRPVTTNQAEELIKSNPGFRFRACYGNAYQGERFIERWIIETDKGEFFDTSINPLTGAGKPIFLQK